MQNEKDIPTLMKRRMLNFLTLSLFFNNAGDEAFGLYQYYIKTQNIIFSATVTIFQFTLDYSSANRYYFCRICINLSLINL